MKHRWLAICLLIMLNLALLPGVGRPDGVSSAQSDQRCFVETDQCISGAIRTYWESNGGLPVFGLPITAQRLEDVEGRSLQVQWFERDRLEIQPAGEVTAGRLGVRLLELEGRPWQTFAQVTAADVAANCTFFAETEHSMCNPFLSYWNEQGGLERFGLPVTEPFIEAIEGQPYTVQYYERRRMELHPGLPASPILLGLLGVEVLALQGTGRPTITATPAPRATTTPTPSATVPPSGDCTDQILPALRSAYERVRFREKLGCPMLAPRENIPAATQNFERGQMIWVDPTMPDPPPGGTRPRTIFAIINPGPFFKTYVDLWVAGVDPEQPDVTPPREGLYTPRRGFGKVWIEDPTLRDAIGWAIEPQAQTRQADMQLFEGGVLVRIYETQFVYAFGDPDQPEDVQVVMPQ